MTVLVTFAGIEHRARHGGVMVIGELPRMSLRVASFIIFVVVPVVALLAVDDVRRHEMMAEARDELDAQRTAEEACDEDPGGDGGGEAGFYEVVLRCREHAVESGEDHYSGAET
jgi:hypothetical protein